MAKAEEKKEPVVLTTIVGNVGRNATRKTTSKGDVVNFSVATQELSGKDAPTKWFNVGVWGENLIDQAQQLKKGNRVVVVGKAYETKFNDEPQFNINAYRIGMVDFLFTPRGEAKTTTDADEAGW